MKEDWFHDLTIVISYLPNITENEINNNAYHSYDSELDVRSDLEVQSGGEVFRAVERHKDDSGNAGHRPGTHDDWRNMSMIFSLI